MTNNERKEAKRDVLGFSMLFAFISYLWFALFSAIALMDIVFGVVASRNDYDGLILFVLLSVSWLLGAFTFAGHIVFTTSNRAGRDGGERRPGKSDSQH